jgi:hypothetical protein
VSNRLSRQQEAMLYRLKGWGPGAEMSPGGYRTAGRDASAWHRTVAVLVRLGLVTRTSNGSASFVRITEAGLNWLRVRKASHDVRLRLAADSLTGQGGPL